MQVEAIYNQGRLEFAQPMQLRHRLFKVIVEIPDAEFLSLDEITQTGAAEATIKKRVQHTKRTDGRYSRTLSAST